MGREGTCHGTCEEPVGTFHLCMGSAPSSGPQARAEHTVPLSHRACTPGSCMHSCSFSQPLQSAQLSLPRLPQQFNAGPEVLAPSNPGLRLSRNSILFFGCFLLGIYHSNAKLTSTGCTAVLRGHRHASLLVMLMCFNKSGKGRGTHSLLSATGCPPEDEGTWQRHRPRARREWYLTRIWESTNLPSFTSSLD